MSNPRPTRVLVSGASIAGPALAYWLAKYGFDVTVVERTPNLRKGGYAVDVRGAAIDVIEKMGLAEAVHAADTASNGLYLINANGQTIAQMNDAAIGNQRGIDVEIMREDISQILFDAAKDSATYIWGDSVVDLQESGDGVMVTFERGRPQTFDLVIGADGQHSTTRRLLFGEESQFSYSLGCYISIFTLPNWLKLNHKQVIFNAPGKTVGAYSARNNTEMKALFVFQSEPLHYNYHNADEQKQLLAKAFAAETGWQTTQLLEAARTASDFYFDGIAQIKLPRWYQGRIALVGDAAYGPSPASGQGTSMALVGAYVLAGELKAAAGDYETAFAAYQQQMQRYVDESQKIGIMAAESMIESSASKLAWRNRLLNVPGLMRYIRWQINRMIQRAARALTLKNY